MIRGKMRSRTMKEIVEEATSLDAMGVKELVLIAQDTSAYGIDLYGEYALPELIRGITDATSIPWIRLLYCYPDKITDELVKEIRDNPRVVKYIDIPIQHISDPILRRMNRHGDAAMIRDAVAKLRTIPGMVLRSTAIVGFAFLILYWKTRNIWALALVHGAYDFLASFPLVLGSSEAIGAGSYVREGTEGKIVAVVYMIQIVIVGLITLRVWRKIGKTIDFDNLRESW